MLIEAETSAEDMLYAVRWAIIQFLTETLPAKSTAVDVPSHGHESQSAAGCGEFVLDFCFRCCVPFGVLLQCLPVRARTPCVTFRSQG